MAYSIWWGHRGARGFVHARWWSQQPGISARTGSGDGVRSSTLFNYVVRDEFGNDVTDEADEIYETFVPALEAADDHSYYLQCERPDKADTSFRQILLQYGWNPKTPLERALDFFETEWDIAQYNDGCSTRFWYEHGQGGDFNPFDYILKDPQGYSYITQSFMDDFITEGDHRLHLSQRVTDISQNDTHVTVLTSSVRPLPANT